MIIGVDRMQSVGDDSFVARRGRRCGVFRQQRRQCLCLDVIRGNFRRDAMRHAIRRLMKTPGFTLLCVLTVAFAVGVNTAVFSLVDALLLRPLPYSEPQRLVNLWESIRQSGRGGVATPNFVDLQQQAKSFERSRRGVPSKLTLSTGTMPTGCSARTSARRTFSVLGVNPAMGRAFGNQDDIAHPAVILSPRSVAEPIRRRREYSRAHHQPQRHAVHHCRGDASRIPRVLGHGAALGADRHA